MRTRTTAATLLALLVVAGPLGAGSSLLKDGKTAPEPVVNSRGETVVDAAVATVENTSLIAVTEPEPREFDLHDIIHIIVREQSSSQSEADGEAEKAFELSADLKEWFHLNAEDGLRFNSDENLNSDNPKIDLALERTYEGEGEASTKDSFQTVISARVIDVKPNGNLVLEAKRAIKHNDEEILMTLTGIVRPDDVSITNTVNSTEVADLAVSKTTRGIARDGQKRGWLIQLLEAINPF